MTLRILIVNYRSMRYLPACLESLASIEDSSITVVDNGSGDSEVAQMARYLADIHNAKFVVSAENLGFGAGVNLAALASDLQPHDEVWVLNPDTVVGRGTAKTLQAVIQDGRADIVSPLITSGPEDDQRIWFAGGGVVVGSGKSFHSLFGRHVSQAPKRETYSDFVTGAAPMFRGSTWLALGGFKEDLFLYWEDAELSLRARALGFRLMLVPEARVWHKEGGSGGQDVGLSSTYYYYMQRNRLAVCCGDAGPVRLAFGSGLFETVRLLVKPLIREKHHRLRKFAASVTGLAAGLRGETGQGFQGRP